MSQDYILGITLLERAVGYKEEYDEMDFARAKLPMILSCSRCGAQLNGADARLYPKKDKTGYRAYCNPSCG